VLIESLSDFSQSLQHVLAIDLSIVSQKALPGVLQKSSGMIDQQRLLVRVSHRISHYAADLLDERSGGTQNTIESHSPEAWPVHPFKKFMLMDPDGRRIGGFRIAGLALLPRPFRIRGEVLMEAEDAARAKAVGPYLVANLFDMLAGTTSDD
jgi:hypothetical protein